MTNTPSETSVNHSPEGNNPETTPTRKATTGEWATVMSENASLTLTVNEDNGETGVVNLLELGDPEWMLNSPHATEAPATEASDLETPDSKLVDFGVLETSGITYSHHGKPVADTVALGHIGRYLVHAIREGVRVALRETPLTG